MTKISEIEREQLFDYELDYGSGIFNKKQILFIKGDKEFLYDDNGNKFLDCNTSHGVCILGHNHSSLVNRVQNQMAKIYSLANSFFTESRSKAYKNLKEFLPNNIQRIFFTNSGTEAIECAIKIARKFTKKTDFIAFTSAFHGRTMGALSATFSRIYRKPFEPLIPGFTHVKFGDIEAVKQNITEKTAAIIYEPIQGEGGIKLASEEFFNQLQAVCEEKNVLLIADEIQSGMGRTGKFLASEYYGLKPDIICLAKGLAGGLPVGACCAKKEIFEAMKSGEHGTTYGANPLILEAVNATLETIRKDGLIKRVEKLGQKAFELLNPMKDDPDVRDVRGKGLMIGVQMRKPARDYIKKALLDEKVIYLASGTAVIRIFPPFIIEEDNLIRAIETLNKIIHALK